MPGRIECTCRARCDGGRMVCRKTYRMHARYRIQEDDLRFSAFINTEERPRKRKVCFHCMIITCKFFTSRLQRGSYELDRHGIAAPQPDYSHDGDSNTGPHLTLLYHRPAIPHPNHHFGLHLRVHHCCLAIILRDCRLAVRLHRHHFGSIRKILGCLIRTYALK